MKGKTALIAGSSGLIGNALLRYLLEAKEYDRVVAIVRGPLNIHHPKLVEKQVDFDKLTDHQAIFATADDVFCCLGTTIKKAVTKEAMYKVDVEYPLAMAKMASLEGAHQFLVISSLSSDANSPIWYSRMKGILEQELAKMTFDTISILRPSLLLGKRKEFRLGERVAGALFGTLWFIFLGPLNKYKPIKGEAVALAMYRIAQLNRKGVTIYPSEKITKIAKSQPQ